jgi:hypothetical protein
VSCYRQLAQAWGDRSDVSDLGQHEFASMTLIAFRRAASRATAVPAARAALAVAAGGEPIGHVGKIDSVIPERRLRAA